MRKHHKLLLTAAATAAVAATGVTAASASPVTAGAIAGIEYVQIMSTASGSSGPSSAIARGVFAAGGQARLGDARIGTITFPGGTIVLSHHAGHGSSHFDPKGCLSVDQPVRAPTRSCAAPAGTPGSAATAPTS